MCQCSARLGHRQGLAQHRCVVEGRRLDGKGRRAAAARHRIGFARDLVDAARRALAIQRDPGSWATVFTVHGERQGAPQVATVDLDPEGLDPSGNGTPEIELTG